MFLPCARVLGQRLPTFWTSGTTVVHGPPTGDSCSRWKLTFLSFLDSTPGNGPCLLQDTGTNREAELSFSPDWVTLSKVLNLSDCHVSDLKGDNNNSYFPEQF